jgi:hypothetical protein
MKFVDNRKIVERNGWPNTVLPRPVLLRSGEKVVQERSEITLGAARNVRLPRFTSSWPAP